VTGGVSLRRSVAPPGMRRVPEQALRDEQTRTRQYRDAYETTATELAAARAASLSSSNAAPRNSQRRVSSPTLPKLPRCLSKLFVHCSGWLVPRQRRTAARRSPGERLLHEAVGAQLARGGRHLPSADRSTTRGRNLAGEPGEKLAAVHVRHPQIEHQDVRRGTPAYLLQRGAPPPAQSASSPCSPGTPPASRDRLVVVDHSTRRQRRRPSAPAGRGGEPQTRASGSARSSPPCMAMPCRAMNSAIPRPCRAGCASSQRGSKACARSRLVSRAPPS